MPFSTIAVKFRLVIPKTNQKKKKKQNRRLKKFICKLNFLKSYCK